MEQVQSLSAPTTGMESQNLKKNNNTAKIVAIIMSVIAVAGIAFGVYGMMRSQPKDQQISELKVQMKDDNGIITEIEADKIETDYTNGTTVTILDSSLTNVQDLHFIGDIYTERKYYLGINDLDPSKDTREVDTYIIDTTKLGTKDGVRKYDLKTVLDEVVNERVASLPDTLAAETVNALPKSSCQSYSVKVGDINNLLTDFDWTTVVDWDSKLPLTIYMSCNFANDSGMGEMSLGTYVYSLDPNTNELTQLTSTAY